MRPPRGDAVGHNAFFQLASVHVKKLDGGWSVWVRPGLDGDRGVVLHKLPLFHIAKLRADDGNDLSIAEQLKSISLEPHLNYSRRSRRWGSHASGEEEKKRQAEQGTEKRADHDGLKFKTKIHSYTENNFAERLRRCGLQDTKEEGNR